MSTISLRRIGLADDPENLKPNLQHCLEAALGQSDYVLEDILSGLQLALSGAAGKTFQMKHTSANLEAVNALVADATALKQDFAAALRKALYGGESQRKTHTVAVHYDDFQFLEDEQIDANIGMALTQQEVERSVEDILPALNALVSTLLGWVSPQGHLNPLKPESFMFALREAITPRIPEPSVRTAVMMPAAGLLGGRLRDLYKELIHWMRMVGVEPAVFAGSKEAAAALAKNPENSVVRTMLTLDKLKALLSGELDPNGPTHLDFMHTVPASLQALQDLKMVEPMMKRLAERAVDAARPNPMATSGGMLDTVGQQRERVQGKRLGLQLGQEVLRLMLESLVKDRQLLPKVRETLQNLEPALARLSQADPRFFSDRQHVARQLLDKITHRSLAFASDQDPAYPRFQKQIDNAAVVLQGGAADAPAFARVLRKLEESWALDESEQRKRGEEAAMRLMHVEQRNMLAQRLAQDYQDRVRDKQVPELVVQFLCGPWAQVVAEAQLNCTDGSPDAGGYQSLVDDLVWSVRFRLARKNRVRLVAIVPSMLVKMRDGLELIGYPEANAASFFDALISLHERAFEVVKVNSPAAVGAAVDDTDIPSTLAIPLVAETDAAAPGFWMAEQESRDSGFVRDSQLQGENAVADTLAPTEPAVNEPLAIGSWVNLMVDQQWVRAQLKWASPHRTLFMFISGAGFAHSMSRRTMDRLTQNGSIQLISDGKVLDRALDAVAHAALRNDVENASRES